jgi:hypothetical protein
VRRAEAGILAEIGRGVMTAAELGAFRAWVQAERARGNAPLRRVYGV